MTLGFAASGRVKRLRKELLDWELFQVMIEKHQVQFWFEDGHCLLNAAFRFSFLSADLSIDYVYDIQAPGNRKLFNIDPILRRSIIDVLAMDARRLALVFDNEDTLVIHDSPSMRSAWFYRYDPNDHNARVLWCDDDVEGDDDFL